MGFIDRIRSYAERAGDGGEGTRSPLERDLVAVLQERLAQGDGVARYRLRFTGNVQGVGFRWTNQGTARELHLTGWVKNLADGSVEMELQGPCSGIIRHLDTVHAYYDRMRCRVWLAEAAEEPEVGDEDGFCVRY